MLMGFTLITTRTTVHPKGLLGFARHVLLELGGKLIFNGRVDGHMRCDEYIVI